MEYLNVIRMSLLKLVKKLFTNNFLTKQHLSVLNYPDF
jgi:hypothetical protein